MVCCILVVNNSSYYSLPHPMSETVRQESDGSSVDSHSLESVSIPQHVDHSRCSAILACHRIEVLSPEPEDLDIPWANLDRPYRFSQAYIGLLRRIVIEGFPQKNKRTQHEVRAIAHAKLTHDCSIGIPLPGLRKVYCHTAAAELAWSLQGTEDIRWLQQYTNIWDDFATDAKVDGAYGHRWRQTFGRDQIQEAITTLREDPSCRQVHIDTWDARVDGLDPHSKKLAPCPVSFTLTALDGSLHCSVNLRSSDVVVGLPYDTLLYHFLLNAFAEETGLQPGKLTMFLANAHIYTEQLPATTKLLERPQLEKSVPVRPHWTINAIAQNPDAYVQAIQALEEYTVQSAPKMPFRPVKPLSYTGPNS